MAANTVRGKRHVGTERVIIVQVYLILALGFAIVVAVFAVQNAGEIVVTFLTWRWQTSAVVVILGAATLGALSAGLLGLVRELRLKLKMRQLHGRVNRLETLVQELEGENEGLLARLETAGNEAAGEGTSPAGTGVPTSGGVSFDGGSSGDMV